MQTENNYQEIMRQQLSERIQKNPQYSLRAFARDLGLSPSRLSEILSGQQGLSRERALLVAKNLGFTSIEQMHFADLVESQHARSEKLKKLAQARLNKIKQEFSPDRELAEVAFRTISDWYHFAILELFKLEGFEPTPKWMAQQIQVPELEIKNAIDRLLRLNLLKVEGKKMVAVKSSRVTTEVPSQAIKKFHQAVLQKAQMALLTQKMEERDFATVIMAVDEGDLPKAKALLKKQRQEFSKLMVENSSKKNAVYALSTVFFRLNKKGDLS